MATADHSGLARSTLLVHEPNHADTLGIHTFYLTANVHQSYLSQVDESRRGPGSKRLTRNYNKVSVKELDVSYFVKVGCW